MVTFTAQLSRFCLFSSVSNILSVEVTKVDLVLIETHEDLPVSFSRCYIRIKLYHPFTEMQATYSGAWIWFTNMSSVI